jgi:hypothetical protein
MILAISGCTKNSRKALIKTVTENRSIRKFQPSTGSATTLPVVECRGDSCSRAADDRIEVIYMFP